MYLPLSIITLIPFFARYFRKYKPDCFLLRLAEFPVCKLKYQDKPHNNPESRENTPFSLCLQCCAHSVSRSFAGRISLKQSLAGSLWCRKNMRTTANRCPLIFPTAVFCAVVFFFLYWLIRIYLLTLDYSMDGWKMP